MPDNLIFILVLLGHVVGDFYAQTNNMAKSKDGRFGALLLHAGVYALCMGLVLWAGIPISRELLRLAALLGIAHLWIDGIKFLFLLGTKRIPKLGALAKNKSIIFTVDQCAHILLMVAILWIRDWQLAGRSFLSHQVDSLPAPSITILLGFLCVLRPVGMLIERGEILKPFKPEGEEEDNAKKNAGIAIGYLERSMVFLFLLYKQYGAMAFVLTAKSIARFKEMEQSKEKAEYYLIGTLFSVASAFVIAFVLGLCR